MYFLVNGLLALALIGILFLLVSIGLSFASLLILMGMPQWVLVTALVVFVGGGLLGRIKRS